MRTTYECIPCAFKQGINVAKSLNMEEKKLKTMIQEILKYLSKMDYAETTPPELAKVVYEIIYKYTEVEDPFKQSKEYYNKKLLTIQDDLKKYLKNHNDFDELLKFVISGNIIDFGAIHDLSEEEIFKTIENIEDNMLSIDHSSLMEKAVKNANSIFYIGDNCGEIVFDKLFISYLKDSYKINKIYFGVRGGPIINDITREDALETGINELAEIYDTGVKAPGVLLDNLKKDFKDKLFEADLVIAKGQGNFESLSSIKRDNMFFLFMAKCSVVADKLGVKEKSLICKKI
ncbi:MAG: DUF89 family protein [Candidatus Mcinerneyibacterium aminivorans]|uniref:DUF89 family protein n=1 Tax=Candidatus Mcinerneyibacterium aminivorans TaxID=2703815 RepID=A0A5D0MND0_9BACT|nr:MAG: DUF89 family protein [Candidatus Mcinerneyibacterium aminivorans]